MGKDAPRARGRRDTGRARSWAARAALVAGSLAVCAAAVELVIRIAGVSVGTVYINRRTVMLDPDPQLRFRLKPGAVAHAEVDYRINALGLRGPEIGEAKPSGTRRIVVAGDSIAFGYWVAVEDAFPLQIERLANGRRRSGDRVEVVNLGVPGYNLNQSLTALRRRGFRFRPDLVVVSVCLNDLESVFSYEYGLTVEHARARRADSGWGRLRLALLERSMFAAFVEYRLEHLALRREWATRPPLRAAASGPAAPKAGEAPDWERRQREQRAELDAVWARLDRLLRANGDVPGLIVLFPGLDYELDDYPHLPFHALVRESAAAAGLPMLDLLDCYRGYRAEELRVDPLHPSPLGHRVAAHAIVDVIARRGLLPGLEFGDAEAGCRDYRAADFRTVRGY